MRILTAEDDPISRLMLQGHLEKWGYEVVTARDGNQAWQILQSPDAPRLAILDWIMPGVDGIELCRRMRQDASQPYTYLILLTALAGSENLCAGMDAGADDYLSKPVNLNELQVRLRAGRRIVELQDQLIAARDALREKAAHDPLTGLWNHEEIIGCLERELSRSSRTGQPVAVVMADIDNFKMVNDRFGHLAGDVVLRSVSDRLLHRMRPYDCVGRFGGEEFLIVLAGCTEENAQALAERLRLIIDGEPVDAPEGMIPITMSLGVSVSTTGNQSAADLIRAADQAMYRAKRQGRNRVEVGWTSDADGPAAAAG